MFLQSRRSCNTFIPTHPMFIQPKITPLSPPPTCCRTSLSWTWIPSRTWLSTLTSATSPTWRTCRPEGSPKVHAGRNGPLEIKMQFFFICESAGWANCFLLDLRRLAPPPSTSPSGPFARRTCARFPVAFNKQKYMGKIRLFSSKRKCTCFYIYNYTLGSWSSWTVPSRRWRCRRTTQTRWSSRSRGSRALEKKKERERERE